MSDEKPLDGKCPICEQALKLNPRYPNAVCRDCMSQAVDQQSRKVVFYNTDLGGGFAAQISDTQEPYHSDICFIRGMMCRAEERYFGGIVISPCEV